MRVREVGPVGTRWKGSAEQVSVECCMKDCRGNGLRNT